MAEIIINGRPVEYTLKTSARAKRISITIKHDRITVTMPVGANTQQALSFLESKQDWLARHLKENHRQMAGSGRPDELSNQILYLGRWHQAELGRSKGRKIQIGLTANTVQILLPDRLPGVEGQEVKPGEELEEALISWYRGQAAMICGEKLHYFSKIMHLTLESYRIKEQQTRWGSCSTRRNINLNWRIILAPEAVVDYVIVHELAHLKQMNHSPLFWQEVENILPDFARERSWLRINGGFLQKYNPVHFLI